MKRILFTLITLLTVCRAFSQTTPPPVNPTAVPTMQWFIEPSTGKMFANRGNVLKWWQPTDSLQVKRMITAFGGSYAFSNGLTNTSGTVGLGGTLTQPSTVLIGNNNNSLIIGVQSAPVGATASTALTINSFGSQIISGGSGPRPGQITISTHFEGDSTARINYKDNTSNQNSGLSIGTTGMLIFDGNFKKGLSHDGTIDRTLWGDNNYVDKRFLDSVAAVSGISPDSVLHPNKNLYDVPNKATARLNLGAYSSNGGAINGSVFVNTPSIQTVPDSIIFFGDSYIAGFGVLSYQKMSTVAAGKLNAVEVNFGVGGSTVEEQSPLAPFRVSSYVARRTNIPVYNDHYLALVINGSINDPTLNSANYNITNYTSDLGTNLIDYATTTRGWPANKILLISQPYKSPTSYVSRNGNPAATDAINVSFANATRGVAITKGTLYLDAYNLLKNSGGKLLQQADSLHLNPSGHRIEGNAIANAIGYTIKQNVQQLIVNGLSQLSKIKLSSTDTLQSKGHFSIAADSLGNLVYAPNRYIGNATDTTKANAQGANVNVNGIVRGGKILSNASINASGGVFSNSYFNSSTSGTYPANKTGVYLMGSTGRGFLDAYSPTVSNSAVQLDIQSQSLGDVNIYGNINFKSAGKLVTTSSPFVLNTYLQFPNATGVYPGTKTGGLMTANVTAMYIDAFSPTSTALPLYLNNQASGGNVESYGSFFVRNAKSFTVGTGVSTFGGPVFISPFTTAGVVTNNGSSQLVSTPSLSATLGGTAQTTYTTGDILYAPSANVLAKLPLGSVNQVLTVNSGLPAWRTNTPDTATYRTAANSYSLSGMQTKLNNYVLAANAFVNPMTTLGDVIYGGSSGVATRLAGNATTTRKFLSSLGSGGASTAPTFFDLYGANNIWSGTNNFQSTSTFDAGVNTVGVSIKGGNALNFYNVANTFTTSLSAPNSTSNRPIQFPDAAGTVALTSDIPNSLLVLATVTGINTKNTGTTVLYTVPAGKTAIITSAYIRCTAATAITVGPSVDIGVTAGDIYPNTALTTLNATNKTFGFFSTGISQSPTATQVINFNVNTAATGTSQTVEVVVLGILR